MAKQTEIPGTKLPYWYVNFTHIASNMTVRSATIAVEAPDLERAREEAANQLANLGYNRPRITKIRHE
jgi:hypothetical protein